MAKRRSGARAPEYYGAWVEGRYYNPGDRLPAGTTDYYVIDYEVVEARVGSRDSSDMGYRTARASFEVGTSIDDIEAELGDIYEYLESKDHTSERR